MYYIYMYIIGKCIIYIYSSYGEEILKLIMNSFVFPCDCVTGT